MSRHGKEFYRDFDAFLVEVAAELDKQGKLSPAWVSAASIVGGVALVQGLSAGSAGVAAFAGGLGLLAGPVAWAIVGGVIGATAVAAAAGLKKRKTVDKDDEARETQRLRNARRVYARLQRMKVQNPTVARKQIDKLFEDLVEGRPIVG